jgi:hypothetical protein
MAVLKLEDQVPGAALPDLDPARLRDMGARILRRLIDQWPRLPTALAQYQIALIEVRHNNRTADVFGTLLALADLIL